MAKNESKSVNSALSDVTAVKSKKSSEVSDARTVEWTYIWLSGDGSIRSAVFNSVGKTPKVQRFDGSACKQASTDNSDLFLVPVRVVSDVLFGNDSISPASSIVLCEVQTADGTPHASNSRADLKKFLLKNSKLSTVKIGMDQDILFIDPDTRQPYSWPLGKNEKGEQQVVFPGPQGRYYGGTGDFVRGRRIMSSIVDRMNYRGINIRSYNPAICLSQWTYSVQENDIMTACDDLIISRYICESVAEEETSPRCVVSYTPKSFPGTEWNGSGCIFRLYLENYTSSGGNASLAKSICETLGQDHREHIAAYGSGNEARLVGKTGGISDYNKFSWGFGDKTASICVPTIPLMGDSTDHVYFEDRRPSAGVDPYVGVLALCRSLVGVLDLQVPTKAEVSAKEFEPKLVS
jgi:glutamine synthetase